MPRAVTMLCVAVLTLGAGACGDEPAAPPPEPPPPTETVANPITDRIAELKTCLGGEEVTRVDVFEPTYQYALSQGGGGFAMTLRGQQMQFLVFPDEPSAQRGYQDAQDQLIALQQRDPERYQAVAATAMQTLGTVVQIVPTGASPGRVGERVTRCVSASAA